MKLLNCWAIIVLLFLALFLSVANASLVDNLDGTVTQTRLDGSRLMWLQDALYAYTSNHPDADGQGRMTWPNAVTWAEGLIFAGYSDWRLPSALNSDGTGPCSGTNCDDSEMGYLYNIQGVSMFSQGPFINIFGQYWSGTDDPGLTAWDFHFDASFQDSNNDETNYFSVWAVRELSPASVPVPGALWLFGSGLIGLIGIAKHKKA